MDWLSFFFCSKRQLRTKTNGFVVSLAVADFFVGMTAVPSLFVSKDSHPEDGPYELVDVKHFIRWLFIDASVTNICSLVLDRYMTVVKPLKYLTFMTYQKVIQTISLSWATPVVFITVESALLFSFNIPVIYNIFICLVMIVFWACSMLFVNLLCCLHVMCCFFSTIELRALWQNSYVLTFMLCVSLRRNRRLTLWQSL